MDAMEAQLRETYAVGETEDLIGRLARGGLTETAEHILRQELAHRQVSPGIIVDEQLRLSAAAKRHEALASRLASLPARLAAALIDHIGTLILLTVVNFAVYATTPKAFSDFIGWIGLLGWFAYIFFKDGFNGQSLGKRIVRIRVVDKELGVQCTLPKSFLRNLLGMLGFIDWLFALGASRQRLGDHAANTLVVRA